MSRKIIVVLLVLLSITFLGAVIGCGCSTTPGTTIEETTPSTTPQTTMQTQPETTPAATTQTEPVITTPPPPPPVNTATEAMVVVTRTGGKYHTANCRYVTGKTDTRTITLSQAKSEGYTPCSVCNPPQ